MTQPKFIASCSFGKDSMAAILLAKEHGDPLDEAVYCEVMFDKDISGEVPEHRDFIYSTAIPALERMGVKVVVLRSEQTYVGLFTGRVTRGQRKGMVRSFPLCGKCAVQRDCKAKPLERYKKMLPTGTVRYIGIAKDEQERLLRLDGAQTISLLDKYNFTEQDAKKLCRQAGLLSPVYEFTDRGGCWFCPNAKQKELRHRKIQPHPTLRRHRRAVPKRGWAASHGGVAQPAVVGIAGFSRPIFVGYRDSFCRKKLVWLWAGPTKKHRGG